MKKITSLVLSMIFSLLCVQAQDVHFTQQFDNDIYLNPAQSGLGKKANRLVLQYRDQWRSVPVPYASAFISYDRRIIHSNNNLFGGGIQLVYDRSGDGHLSTIKASISPSYTRYFADNKLGLSVGFQVGMIHRFIDTDALIFESQFDGTGVNNPSGEALSGSVTAPDLGFGVQLSSKLGEKKHDLTGGFSMYNFHEPNLSFVENGTDPRPVRYNAYVKSEIFVGDSWSINPVIEYQRQEKLDNVLPTIYAKKYLNNGKRMAVSFGGGYRVNDAAHIYLAYEVKDFKIGVNYDVNTSAFNDATNTVGAGEILLKYEFERKKKEVVIEEIIDTVYEDTTELVEEEIIEEEEEIKETEEVVTQPEVPIKPEKPVKPVPPSIIEEIASGVNINLFFPNDYPDPRSTSPNTKSWYGDIYRKYISMSVDYYRIGGEEGNMVDFIDNYVIKEWKRYNSLVSEITKLLAEGKTVTLVVRGHTSPLANNDYNLNLSKRRVESFVNQVTTREDLDEYFKNGQLIIQRQPFGETKSDESVSDDANNAKQSVYSDKASYERRVEIEKVIVE